MLALSFYQKFNEEKKDIVGNSKTISEDDILHDIAILNNRVKNEF